MHDYSYDRLPYPTRSHVSAHVRRLEAVATLFGMRPRAITGCRVLELGCAAGWNLIPQAAEYSGSQFLGVELSARQVSQGQTLIEKLGLGNVELRRADILEIDASWGRFDFILCHGVYSWVPVHVQEKILAICKDNLAPDGVALVSYNVLPGWHFRGAIRDMMLYHVSQFDQPEEKISQARAVLDFMAENCPSDTAYGQVLREELAIVRKAQDAYLYHDHLEDHNHAVYFHEFIQRAEVQGLQYLGDTDVASMLPRFLSGKAQSALASVSLVKQEQYLDFLRNRTLRRTLLCHDGVALTRSLERDILKRFHVSLVTRPEPFKASLDPEAPLTIRVGEGQVTTRRPVAMAVLEHMSSVWPASMTPDALRLATIERLSAAGNGTSCAASVSIDDVTGALMEIFAAGLLEFYVHPPAIACTVSHCPAVSPVARHQARAGNDVTNQRHENVSIDDFSRYLIPLLDSRHGREQLFDNMRAAIANGEVTMQKDGRPVRRVEREILDGFIDTALAGMCQASLLTA